MTRAHIDHPDLAFAADPNRGCADRPDLTWHPTKGANQHEQKAICHACPVLEPCRDWGLRREHYGLWGGLAERERRRTRLTLGITVESPHTNPVRCGTPPGYDKHVRNREPICDPCRKAYNAAAAARRERRRGAA